MKATNQLTRFLAIVISIVVFFILAGLGNLFSQETHKYPVGYTLSFDPKVDKKAYILSPGTGFKSSHVVDSFYVNMKDFSYQENLSQDALTYMLTQTYLCSEGNEIFVYLDSTEIRNQENWPQVDKVTSKYYGKMVENTISLRKEITKEQLRKGWTGPIIALSWMGIFFILLISFHIWVIKEREDIETFYFFILVVLLGLMSIPWLTNTIPAQDKFGYTLYRKIWLCVTLLSVLTTIISGIFLKKYKEKHGLI